VATPVAEGVRPKGASGATAAAEAIAEGMEPGGPAGGPPSEAEGDRLVGLDRWPAMSEAGGGGGPIWKCWRRMALSGGRAAKCT